MAESITTFRDIKKSKEEMRKFADLIKDYLVHRIIEVYGYETTIITEINMRDGEITLMPYGAHQSRGLDSWPFLTYIKQHDVYMTLSNNVDIGKQPKPYGKNSYELTDVLKAKLDEWLNVSLRNKIGEHWRAIQSRTLIIK